MRTPQRNTGARLPQQRNETMAESIIPHVDRRHGAERNIVVMGVCGCGKSTVGQLIARARGLEYLEGDLSGRACVA